MNRSKWLRVILVILGLYWALYGILMLFAPGAAEAMFSIELPDRVLVAFTGLCGLVIALMAFLVSTDPVKYARLVWAFVVLLAGEILINGYFLVSAQQTFQQAGPPIIITAVLLVLLLVFRVQRETLTES
jgi:hypothetical protein